MKQLAALVCLLVLTGACGASPPTMPSSSSSQIAPSGFRLNYVGQEVKTSLEHNDQDVWEFTAQFDGTLVVTVTWTAPGTVALSLDDVLSSESNKSPIVARMQVASGQRIRVKVAQPAAWLDGEGWYLPVTISTAMERTVSMSLTNGIVSDHGVWSPTLERRCAS